MSRKLSIAALVLLAGSAMACQVQMRTGSAEQAKPAPAPTPSAAPAPAPAPVVKKSVAQVKGDKVSIPGNIVFETGKASFQPGDKDTQNVLEQLKLYLVENPEITRLRIEGNTDNVGKTDENLKLSGERALTVKKWLTENGIPKERLLAVGFGDTKPIADNSTEPGRAQNRRTEFKIAERNGKRFLGFDPNGGGTVFGE